MMSLAESKHKTQVFFAAAVPSAISASWTYQSFFTSPTNTNTIQPGTGVDMRIGNKIFVKSIEYRFIVKPTGGAGMDITGGNTCRFVIFHDKQTNGQLIAPGLLFRADNVNTTRNQDQLKRVLIKRDMIMTMMSTSGTTVGPTYPIIGKFAVNKVFNFVSNTDSIAAFLKDNYGFAVISDFALCCEMYGEWIVHFTDV